MMKSGGRPSETRCNECRYHLLPEHQRESICAKRCGVTGPAQRQTAMYYELFRCHLRLLGGETLELPSSWHAAIGYMRTELAVQMSRGVLMESIATVMGGKRV